MSPIFLNVALLTSLQSVPQTAANTSSVDPNEIPFVSVESGQDSPLHKFGVFAFTTPDQFKTYLSQINETTLKKPKTDWTQQEIIAVQAKGVTQDGNSIKIKRIHRTSPGHVTIEVVVLKTINANPQTPINLSEKTTYPYAIIQTSKITEKIDVQVLEG